MTPQQIQALETLPPELQAKYSSIAAARFNKTLIKRYTITEAQMDAFLEAKGDFILQLLSKEELVTALQALGLTQDIATNILREIQTDTAAPDTTTTAPTVSATNTPDTGVEPIRTMADDIEKVHGYGAYRGVTEAEETEEVHQSTQDTIIPNKPLAEAPTYDTPEAETPAAATEEAPTRWQSSVSPE